MMSYKFSTENQSPWLVEIYNQYLPYKMNGFLVEIGVGHTIKGIDKVIPENLTKFERVGSNTGDLLDLGWSGIYVDPVKEYCDEAIICHKNNIDRLTIVNMGASDEENELPFYLGDSFKPNTLGNNGYSWVGRTIKTLPTHVILTENKCPTEFDVMSIDVEGFEDRVLLGMDFDKHKPKIIVLEVNQIGHRTINKILPDDYEMVKSDGLNAVWVSK